MIYNITLTSISNPSSLATLPGITCGSISHLSFFFLFHFETTALSLSV